MCTFKSEYSTEWPCLKLGFKGESFVFCETCVCEFSVKSGGRDDCRRLIESDKHKRYATAAADKKKNQKISSFFAKPSTSGTSSIELDVTRCEVMMVELALSMNTPMTVVDTFSKALKQMCHVFDLDRYVPDFVYLSLILRSVVPERKFWGRHVCSC